MNRIARLMATGVLWEKQNSLLNGLLAYWKLDEASGDAIDVLGLHNLTQTNNPLGVAGKVGNARNLVKASTQYIKSTTFGMPDSDWTISFWANFSAKSDNDAVMSSLATYPNGQFLLAFDTSKLIFNLYPDVGSRLGYVYANTFGALSTGVYYHILLERIKASGKIAISVNLTRDEGNTIGTMGTSTTFTIGAWSSGAHPCGETVDECCAWGRILNDAEKARLYNVS